jgi:hypothetical protein
MATRRETLDPKDGSGQEGADAAVDEIDDASTYLPIPRAVASTLPREGKTFA